MGRLHLFEFEDQPWFPKAIRAGMTDYLHFVGTVTGKPYERHIDRLAEALRRTGDDRLLDLGTGGGGPTPLFLTMLEKRHALTVAATLTDLHPDLARLRWLASQHERVDIEETPVSAEKVGRPGFRVMNNAFHHLDEDTARAVLRDAYESREGIAIFEGVGRHAAMMIPMPFFLPLLVVLATLFIRPVRPLSWLFTFIIPLIPLFTLWDGFVSCLRVYSPEELRALTEGMNEGYRWEVGHDPVPGGSKATYLIGTPIA